ncbi:SDR family oxidoreductase [Kineococcus terrestris]|uniref:SDR family oxidoreductase n=1 Tax=Kineococcus terrestris TaxID=2044856 RepID=UPI0034DB2EF3
MTTFLITGAGSGFGKGVALRLAQLGHEVIAGVQIWPQVWQLRQEAGAAGVRLEVVKLDTTNALDRAHAFSHDIDVLFNNAGVMHTGPATEVPESLWRESFDVNLFATIEMTRGFVPALVEKGRGRIVFVSSIAGFGKVPFLSPYAATKHALEAFAGILRQEVADYGITVQTVNPGPYLTGFNDVGFSSMHQWFDADTATIAVPSEFIFEGTLPGQYDPEEMITAMVQVLTGESNAYRTTLPTEVAAQIKADQAAEWDLTVPVPTTTSQESSS